MKNNGSRKRSSENGENGSKIVKIGENNEMAAKWRKLA